MIGGNDTDGRLDNHVYQSDGPKRNATKMQHALPESNTQEKKISSRIKSDDIIPLDDDEYEEFK